MFEMTSGSRPPKRMTLALPSRTASRLSRLQELTDASSAVEVIRNALLVYEVIAETAQQGGQLMFKDMSGKHHILPICVDVDQPAGPLPGEGVDAPALDTEENAGETRSTKAA